MPSSKTFKKNLLVTYLNGANHELRAGYLSPFPKPISVKYFGSDLRGIKRHLRVDPSEGAEMFHIFLKLSVFLQGWSTEQNHRDTLG